MLVTQVPKIHYFIFDDIVSTDKMAEKKLYFGRKWQLKNLHISKKSSTFVASKDKKYVKY